MTADETKAQAWEQIEAAAHSMADCLSYIDQAAFLRGVADSILKGEPDADWLRSDRYYRAGFHAAEKAF